ncbi:RT0821/Lpp0805 family surface protein [Rhizobium leguminosarum]|uniref:RT0821/Lpp0805 family surface protein n=1 Tax=Rhizobium leguminosarum TaxID=384 RepID=UPI0028F42337|nr:RT0821/Lpp0805 family surface protein [Rhizobium leguminosarum]
MNRQQLETQPAKRFTRPMNLKHFISAISIAALAACSHIDPLETPFAQSATQHQTPLTDQAVIADTVGRSAVGANALAWANPSTGSAGVIEQIDASNDGPDGCRGFVTSRQSLDGITRFNGVACPSGDSWKLGGQ